MSAKVHLAVNFDNRHTLVIFRQLRRMLINVNEFRGALTVDNWKLIVYASLPSRIELYNVADDPSEEHDQSKREPDRVRNMRNRLNE